MIIYFCFSIALANLSSPEYKDKKSDNYYAQAATLTELKKKDETIWLKEVNSQSSIVKSSEVTGEWRVVRGQTAIHQICALKNI